MPLLTRGRTSIRRLRRVCALVVVDTTSSPHENDRRSAPSILGCSPRPNAATRQRPSYRQGEMGAHKELTGARLRTFRLRARGRALVLVVAAELVLACSAFQRLPITAGLRPAGECACTSSRRQCALSGARASGMTTGPGRLSAASEATTKALHPDKRGSVHFINLSNGIELLPMLQGIPASFVRIQSSHCEANNFNGILGGLDSTFLMYLAMGHDCYIYDLGSRNKKRKAPRAVWYGITFIKYALHM